MKLAGALVLAIAGVAHAGPAAIQLDREDAPAGRVEFGFDGGAPLDTWGASLGLGLLERPLVLHTNPGTRVPVTRRETVVLGGAIAVGEHVVVDARLPLARQSGLRLKDTGIGDNSDLARAVLGDLRIAARVRVAGSTASAMFARLALTLPTGDDANFAGEPGVGGQVMLIGRLTLPHAILVAASAGVHVRREVALGDRIIGNELQYAAGVLVPLPIDVAATAEAVGAVGDRIAGVTGPSPLEIRVGLVGHPFGGLTIGARVGVGVIDTVGSPAWRAMVELAWRGDWKLLSGHAAPADDPGDDDE